MVRGLLEVIEFEPRQVSYDAVLLHRAQEREGLWSSLRREHRKLTSGVVAVTVLALHALLVVPAIWATGPPLAHSPDRSSGTHGALQWVTLTDSSPDRPSLPSSFSSPVLAVIRIRPTLPTLTPATSPPEARGSRTTDDPGFEALSGRYIGQIRARIDRAWLRPRTAIGAPIFRCRVQVDQDEQGRVAALTLLECNGDARWQLSLVHAIEEASPLPAPPQQAVFARHLLLEFHAAGYSPGVPEAFYEPAASTTHGRTEAGGDTVGNAFQALREAIQAPHSRGVLELRIEGSKAEVEPDHE